MKTFVNILTGLVISLTIISCNNSSETKKDTDTKNTSSNQVEIVVNALYTKNDKLDLFYLKSGDKDMKGDQVISELVVGQPVLQEITFKLPKNIKPVKLLLALSKNKSQGSISIKNIKIINGDQSEEFDINGGSLQDYLAIFDGKTLQFDESNYDYKLSEDAGNYNPMFISTPQLEAEMKKIFSKKPEQK